MANIVKNKYYFALVTAIIKKIPGATVEKFSTCFHNPSENHGATIEDVLKKCKKIDKALLDKISFCAQKLIKLISKKTNWRSMIYRIKRAIMFIVK